MIEPVTILQLNIEGDKHLDRVEGLLKARMPHVVTMQEVHGNTAPRVAAILGQEYRFVSMASYKNRDTGEAMQKGLLIMWDSSFTLVGMNSHRYYVDPSSDDATIVERRPNQRDRILLVVELQRGGRTYRVLTTHFIWTPDGGVNELQQSTFVAFSTVLDRYDDEQGVLLTGDFNAPRGLEIFDALSRRYTDNIPKDVTTTIDQKLHRKNGLMYVVDGLFTTPNYSVSDVEMIDGVSDHKAIVAKITS